MNAGRVLHLAPREELTDADVMRRIASGELDALGALFDRHHESIRRFVVRVTSDAGDVDDIVQETFLAASRASGSYDGRDSARPFLLGVAAQLVRRRRRTFARWAAALARLGSEEKVSPRSPEHEAGVAEEQARFDAALARLSDEKRLVFVMFEREGVPGDEIASALGIPVNTVWTRLHHARTELRGALARYAK